ncbi:MULTISPECIES: hypothetical protein [Shouchella]|uniref:Uncharacterized protein n=1 Tax=Shouchella hunanensis TaxID=766894 RepID=A0ABY7W782_9BACI|nr:MULTISPECIES: hypothetical protein [Shouchella]WDF04729.1 hypothetical protein PQ477_04520 [Shouchella hunanensis]GAF22060.1 hypothetical protein JCM19047_1793 [Bacillus sp. JCM 19047]
MDHRRTLQTAYTIGGILLTGLGVFLLFTTRLSDGVFSGYFLSPFAMGWMMLCLAYVVAKVGNKTEKWKAIRDKAGFYAILTTLVYLVIAIIITELDLYHLSTTQWLTTISSLIIITLFTSMAILSKRTAT